MEPVIVIVVIGLGFYLIFKMLGKLRRLSRWNDSYIRVGKRYNGKKPNGGIVHAFIFSRPNLSFPYRDTFCQLKSRRGRLFNEKEETQLKIRFPDARIDLEVTTGLFTRRTFRKNDFGRLEFSDPSFQSTYNAAAKDRHRAKQLLSDPVQWQLEQLRMQGRSKDLSLIIRRGVMLVTKSGAIVDYRELDDFTRFALQLFDQLLLAEAYGIEFVNDGVAAVVDDVKCPICSEEIVQDMVVCTRCKTPHCRDCWQYNGQCATFACSETRFLQIGSGAEQV